MDDLRMRVLHINLAYRFGEDVAQAYVKPNDTFENCCALIKAELKISQEHLKSFTRMNSQEYDDAMLGAEIMEGLEP